MTADHPPSAGWRPHPRYPDPAIEILDERFAPYRIFSAAVERLYTGCRWAEGPVWFGDGRYLLWSDIPNDRILKWEEETGAVSVFRRPSNFANGNTRDRQGRLVTCEHGRRVTRTEYDGTITVLLERFEGKRLNSPNDVVVKSDGSIWFTDPPFGLLGHYEGTKAESELPQASTGSMATAARRASWPTTCSARTASASRPTSACSTWSNRAASRTARSWPTTSPRTAASIANKRVLIDAARRHARWHALRRRRQPVVRLGHGQRATRRRARVRARRQADRPHRAARALRQRLLRRPRGATACSWPRASPSTRSTSTPRAPPVGKVPGAAAEPGRAAAPGAQTVHHK